jgi:FkbH-like protein
MMTGFIPTFNELKKLVKKVDRTNKPKFRVALLGNFTTQLLKTAIDGMGLHHSIDLEIYEADYDQINQEVYNPESHLYKFKPDWIIVLQDNQVLKQNYLYQQNNNFYEDYIQPIETLIQNTGARCIINNLYLEKDEIFGSYSSKVEESFSYQIMKTNFHLNQFLKSNGSIFMIDLAGLMTRIGTNSALDNRMMVNASLPYALDFIPLMAYDIVKVINNSNGKFNKCLILDLDNTTWGGIVGDDGMEGIQIGDLGQGKAFKQLQIWAKALKQRGVILAVCSKNEEIIAKEPFQSHPEMILKLEDIAVFVANWKTKVENIKYIQELLNIGFDSMVFLDDNPMERDIVRKHIPTINVPDLPKDPSEYLTYLKGLDLFSTMNYDTGDKDRTAQYQIEAKRVKQRETFTSMKDYLSSLEMEAVIADFDSFHKSRIAQLTQRSNQFNPRTQRYTEEEIVQIMEDKKYLTKYVMLKDKFGDYGLISNIILKKEDNILFIENWVMSCRVFKRKVEKMIMNEVFKIASNEGVHIIKAEYIPTKKNIFAKDLFKNMGFNDINNGHYELKVSDYQFTEHQITIKD